MLGIRFAVFIVYFEHISHLVPKFSLLTLNMKLATGFVMRDFQDFSRSYTFWLFNDYYIIYTGNCGKYAGNIFLRKFLL